MLIGAESGVMTVSRRFRHRRPADLDMELVLKDREETVLASVPPGGVRRIRWRLAHGLRLVTANISWVS